jgi:hypothetical protein
MPCTVIRFCTIIHPRMYACTHLLRARACVHGMPTDPIQKQMQRKKRRLKLAGGGIGVLAASHSHHLSSSREGRLAVVLYPAWGLPSDGCSRTDDGACKSCPGSYPSLAGLHRMDAHKLALVQATTSSRLRCTRKGEN